MENYFKNVKNPLTFMKKSGSIIIPLSKILTQRKSLIHIGLLVCNWDGEALSKSKN